jgi:flagellar secretion chaperone FliS
LEGISEVTTIIKNIKEGWDAIPQEIRQGGQEVAAG